MFVTGQLVGSHVCCLRVSTSKDSTEWKLKQLQAREQGGKLILSKFWKKWENKKTSYPLSWVWSWFNRDFLWNSSTVWSSFYSFVDENAESSGCESFEIRHLCFNQEVRVVWCLTWLGCKYFPPELLHWSNQEIKLRSSGFSQLCANNVKIWLQRISPISCRFGLLNFSVLWEDHLNQYRIRNRVQNHLYLSSAARVLSIF